MTPRGKIFITLGDPAGVGPEIICKSLAELPVEQMPRFSVVGSKSVLERAQKIVGTSLDFTTSCDGKAESIEVIEPELPDEIPDFGVIDKRCGDISYRCIVRAVELCQSSDVPCAIATAPINKEALNLAGHQFDGHTGLLAHLTRTPSSWMLLTSEKLSVIHVSTHVSLSEAIARATYDRVLETIQVAFRHMQRMGIYAPRIAVAGLNPHCGEHGLFGSEDDEQIRPAVKKAQDDGMDVTGPIPPDTVYRQAAEGAYDIVVGQYHDQGHIPMKMIAFDTTVNVSLGLPIDRASVDHGTAFDIAGTGKADHTNMLATLSYAQNLIQSSDEREDAHA